MSRAKVIFTDGFHISPTIETSSEELKRRIGSVKDSGGPASCAAQFVIRSAIEKQPASIHNTPEGRSFGGTVSTIEAPGFWPGNGGDQAGVFLVWVSGERKIDYWGGSGFDDSKPFTPGIPQSEEL